ncbi:MAG: type II toxin-antitoxin system PemK/MazF family toxin [Candidatus Kapabacteria bacterium]|nr:type II toxin-antitoxin system PemK/MazF family toxin [Candidatus Kapabacteria bacterium]
MKRYREGDVVLIAFPFSGGGSKRRPALILADTGDDDVLVACITSISMQTSSDVSLQDWQASGLLAPSVVRLDKCATLEKILIERQLGTLTQRDIQSVARAFQNVFAAWL